MSGPLSGSMLYQYIARSPSAMCYHLSFPYHERGKLLCVVDSAGAPGWPMCSWSQVDVLQQCRKNPGLLCSDWFQEERCILPASWWYIKKYSWPLVVFWHPEAGEETGRMLKLQYLNKEECLSNCSSRLFLVCFCPGLNPLHFIQELICISWWYHSLIASVVLHMNGPG